METLPVKKINLSSVENYIFFFQQCEAGDKNLEACLHKITKFFKERNIQKERKILYMSKQCASLASLAIEITTLNLGNKGVSFLKVEIKYHKRNLQIHHIDYKSE